MGTFAINGYVLKSTCSTAQ